MHFVASAVAHLTDVSEGVDALVFAEDPTGAGHVFEIQRAHHFDKQDQALGMNTYCLVLDGCATYGGAEAAEVSDGTLRIALGQEAADALGLDVPLVSVAVTDADARMAAAHLGVLLGRPLS